MKRKNAVFCSRMKFLAALLCLLLTLSLVSCGTGKKPSGHTADGSQTEEGQGTRGADETDEKGPAYPYADGEGRIRYQFLLNGTPANLPHEPYSMPGQKGAFFPLEDVLNILGVSVVKTEDGSSVGSSINGNIFKATAGQGKMSYGKKSMTPADSSSFPTMVDGVLYVPSFFFMQLSDNSVVDFSQDGTCCTLDTDVVIDPETSGPIGITVEDLRPEASKTTASGRTTSGFHPCSQCGGLGGKTEFSAEMRPAAIGGTPVQTVVSRFVLCPRCGGTGQEP